MNRNTMHGKFQVETHHLAIELGSGNVPVLGTPALIAFMENIASDLAQKDLAPSMTSVGIYIEMEHLKPSKINDIVEINAKITEQTEKTVSFEIEASHEGQIIGKAKHKRAVVERKKFEKNI